MELQLSSIPLLFSSFLFVCMLIKVATKTTTKLLAMSPAPNLPPGPWKLPFIGNMHHLIGGSQVHSMLRDLSQKYGPLMHLQLGEISTIVVSSPEMATEIMKTHDILFAQRPYHIAADILSYNSTDIISSPYGEYWRQLRKICIMEILSAKRVQTFRSIREEEVSDLIQSIFREAKSTINLSKKISSLTFATIGRAAFGKKSKDQEAFISTMQEVANVATGLTVAELYPSIKWLQKICGIESKLLQFHKKFDEILESIVNEHKQRKIRTITENGSDQEEAKEDLVDVLLRIQKHGDLGIPFTDNNIKAVISDMFSAGGETSSTTIQWAMSEMLKNERVLKMAQNEVRETFTRKGNVDESGLHELKYLKSVIKETLRLHPPVPLLLPRECRKQCEINGFQIPAKTSVLVNVWSIGRDPKYWTDAEKFQPERFMDSSIDFKGTDFQYLPFGAGRRMCPGIAFAQPNVELPLAHLLYHFDWELPNGMKKEELDMTEVLGMTIRRKHDLYLIPIPYHPSPVK
ncbi:hypothetical protein RJ640_004330 [Escallonia rubra]|uniref:Cytochrome P450 n=1 Tax=Escallonia rubra TaxID=112253 RepID=A0AA88RH52_9ASTE|nr:hypothetical protein RJ640_004330 [Escallonia rubra]